jgi:hypothetical protein
MLAVLPGGLGNGSELHFAESDGHNDQSVTPTDASDQYASWSQTGEDAVVLRTFGEGDSRNGLYLVTLDGSAEQLTVDNNVHLYVNFSQPYYWWSPDDRYIAFAGYTGSDQSQRGIYLIDLNNIGSVQHISSVHLSNYADLAWSYNSNFVAYRGYEGTNNDENSLYLVDMANPGTEQQLTQLADILVSSFAWSFNSKKIGYVGYTDPPDTQAVGLFTYNMDDGTTTPFTTTGVLGGVGWSRDNKTIQSGYNLVNTDDGSSVEVIIPPPRDMPGLGYIYTIMHKAWSPDSNYIALDIREFWTNGQRNQSEEAMYVFDVNTGLLSPPINAASILNKGVFDLMWSPDSRYFIVGISRLAHDNLFPGGPDFFESSYMWVKHYIVSNTWQGGLDATAPGIGPDAYTASDPDNRYLNVSKPIWIPAPQNIPPVASAIMGINTCPGDLCPIYDPVAQAQVSVGGPIDVQSGNYTYQTADLSAPDMAHEGQSTPLTFHAIYSSGLSIDDAFTAAHPPEDQTFPIPNPLGRGWTHNFDSRLITEVPNEPAVINWQTPNGAQERFAAHNDRRNFTPQGQLLVDLSA